MAHAFRDRVGAMQLRVFDGLGADALYTPAGGGAALALKAIPETADVTDDVFGARLLQTGRRFALLVQDVSVRPAKGATITTLDDDGVPVETFELVEPATSTDRLRTLWICVTDEGEPAATIVEVSAAASSHGSAGAPVLRLAWSAPAAGVGNVGAVSRRISLAPAASCTAGAGAPVRQVPVAAPATGTGRVGSPAGAVAISAPVAGVGQAGQPQLRISVSASAIGTAVAGGVSRVVRISAAATGIGNAGGATRSVPIIAPASGVGGAGFEEIEDAESLTADNTSITADSTGVTADAA